MKWKSYLPPLLLLAALLALSFWNSHVMTVRTDHLRTQLLQTGTLAQAERWDEALELLAASYEDWSAHQTYLHIVTEHDAVDDAEAMYCRLAAFGATEEGAEFQAELADLRDQLRLLAEMERFSIKNIL